LCGENDALLIFDEIDANVGGETAGIIGEKLKSLGTHRQVICITHFPQVASKADHHLRVYKVEKNGRTSSIIENLKNDERKKELTRMLGGTKESLTLIKS
jgi:DNA repair protein RecN (Recombination protein N)